MSMRAVPFCCPYCTEESLEPIGDEKEWYCPSCNRRFTLTFEGLGDRLDDRPEQAGEPDSA